MHRDTMVTAWLARLNGDATLTTLMQGSDLIFPAGANRPVQVPSIEWMHYGNPEGESFEDVFVRLDLFIRGTMKAGQIEKRIRQISHRDTAQTIGGLRGWMRYLDSRDVNFPSDPGVVHRALDWTLETVRDKYGS